MISRNVADGYLVRLDRNEEVISTLTSFIIESDISSGIIQGIGAIHNIEIGYFDVPQKQYIRHVFDNTYEVISLNGNISRLDNKPFVHLHVAIADEHHQLFGGHLFKASVAVTLELYIKTFDCTIERKPDKDFGFNFWHL
ncbi:MAG: PPC domain-containing DNA-binding protein [Candidatus Zixiibacteriota bacterium]